MNRKQFIGSLFAGITIGCNPAFATEQSEFDKCKNDILYWVDNYLSVHDRLHCWLEMSPQQREYLKRMSETKDYLFCAKGRQIGASIANLVFARWRTRFFENQHVFIVEPNLRCAERFQEIDRESIFQLPSRCQEGSMVHITRPDGLRGIDWRDRNNTFILDEYAWWSDRPESFELQMELYNAICEGKPSSILSRIIAVSTPTDHSDLFSTLVNNIDDSRKLVLPSPTRGLKA